MIIMEIFYKVDFSTRRKIVLTLRLHPSYLRQNTRKKYNWGNFELEFICLQQEFIHLLKSSCHPLDTIEVIKDLSFSCKRLGLPVGIVVWTLVLVVPFYTTSVAYYSWWLPIRVKSPTVTCLVTCFLTLPALNNADSCVMHLAFLTQGLISVIAVFINRYDWTVSTSFLFVL